jgi:GNAT superfamily N-acetyltransferase
MTTARVVVTEANSVAERSEYDDFRTRFADEGDRILYAADHDLDWGAERYVLIARDGRTTGLSAIVGSATGWHIGGIAKITDLLVAPAARRKGIASEIVVEFERRARVAGCHRTHAVTAAGSPAEKFWLALGWTIEARLPDHYFRREHVVLSKALKR